MRLDQQDTYWILLSVVKFSGVPWFIRETGIPAGNHRTTFIREAKRFASRCEAIEWGNHLTTEVAVIRVTESRAYVLEDDKG